VQVDPSSVGVKHGLAIGGLAVLWSRGEQRRAVVDLHHADARDLLKRALDRLPGGNGRYESVLSRISSLRDPGATLCQQVGHDNTLAICRPLAQADLSPDPVLIAILTGQTYRSAIVAADLPQARVIAREMNLVTGTRLRWHAFLGELIDGADRFSPRLTSGRAVGRTRMEELLPERRTSSPARRREAA